MCSLRRSARPDDERGAAMIVALSMVMVVMLLSAISVQTSIHGVTGSASVRKQTQTTGAADAGLAAELSNIQSAVLDGNTTTLNCPAGDQYLTVAPGASYGSAGASGAGNAASIESFTLAYATGTTSAGALAGGRVACAGTIDAPAGASTWYLALYATGTAASRALGGVQTRQALVQMNPGLPTGPLGGFGDAIMGYGALLPGGNFDLQGGGDTYTTGQLSCGSTNNFGGNVYAYDPSPPSGGSLADGACDITGNAYVYGSMNLTGGGKIGGSLYSSGNVTSSGGISIGQNLYADGSVYLTGSASVGSIYATSSVELDGDVDVSGEVDANGSFTIPSRSSPTVDGNVYANGPMSISGNPTLKGSLYSTGDMTLYGTSTPGWVESEGNIDFAKSYGSVADAYVQSHSYTITPDCDQSYGPQACYYSLPDDFPPQSSFPTTASQAALPAAQSFPSLTFSQQAWTNPAFEEGVPTRFINDNNCTNVADDIAGMSSETAPPTVIQTSCVVREANITLANNLAIFSTGGFDFDNSGSGVIEAVDPNSHLVGKPDFYAIVPSSVTANGETPTNNCPSESAPNGDIWVETNMSETQGGTANSVVDFLYTPDSFCSGSTPYVNGKVYAGETANFPGGYSQTYASITPYGVTGTPGSGPNTPGTIGVQWIQ